MCYGQDVCYPSPKLLPHMASLIGTHLNREGMSSVSLKPNRAFCWEHGIVTNSPGPWTHWALQTAQPWNTIRRTTAKVEGG